MTPKELSKAKTRIRKFHDLFKDIVKHWGNLGNHYVTLGVLVQNAGHDSSETYEYNHDEDVKELKTIIEIIKKMVNYHEGCHVTQYVYTELNDTVTFY